VTRSSTGPSTPSLEPGRREAGRRARMLLCAAGTSFLIMLDSNIVAVSLPAIARDLHGVFTDIEWVVSAYLLSFAALLMAAGALADRLGRRRVLLAGLSIFTASSLLCGLAPGTGLLNAARALQGAGAALQLSAALAVIGHGFRGHERARAFAFWGTVVGVAVALGPIVGGLITSYLGWRWAFLINVPVGAVLIALAMTSVDESRDVDAQRLDLPGILLFAGGLLSIVWALIAANGAGWDSPSTLTKLGLGLVLLVAFSVVERLQARPMVELELFRDRTVLGAAIAMLGYAATAQVMVTILPLYLQDAFALTPDRAGLGMIPFALPLMACPMVASRLSARMSGRALLALGLGVVSFGNAVVALAVTLGAGYAAVAIGMAATGAGAGLLNGETTKVQINAVPPGRAGMASGIAGTTRFVGIVVGIAGLGAVLAAIAERRLRGLGIAAVTAQTVNWHSLSLRIVGGDAAGGLSALAADLRTPLEPALRASVSAGFGAAFAVAALFAAVSSILAWALVRATDTRPSTPTQPVTPDYVAAEPGE
jgi:EmrB/QacA subfamily drug resistance transporter